MKIRVIESVAKFLEKLSQEQQAKVLRYIELFEEFGFSLTDEFLRKIDKNIWELRPRNIRILLGKAGNHIWVVHAFVKKGQKTPKKEIELANKRLRELR